MEIQFKVRYFILLLIIFSMFGNNLYAKKIKEASKPGKSTIAEEDEDYQEEEYKPSKSKRSSEDDEENEKLKQLKKEKREKIKQAEKEGSIYIPKEWPEYEGPKKSIAVLDFEDGMSKDTVTNVLNDKDSFIRTFYGFGEGLASMLVSTLHKSERFEITEKKIANRVFEMYSTDAAEKVYTSGRKGITQVPGIQYFVLGSITDAPVDTGGIASTLGLKGLAFGKKKSVSSVSLHMRIIDTSKGTVVYSKRLEGIIVSTSASLAFDVMGVGVGGSKFEKSPLGQAIQMLMDQCADDIIAVTCD